MCYDALDYFTAPVSRLVWDTRYRYRDAGTVHDKDVDATWQRVARAVAAAETQVQGSREDAFYQLQGRQALPLDFTQSILAHSGVVCLSEI